MVKVFLAFCLLLSVSFANENIKQDTPLIEKIKSLIEPEAFEKDKAYIKIVFSPTSEYYKEDGSVNSVKVIQTLKTSGILNLFFKKPREVTLTFKTDAQPLFFVKIMSDTLRNIGYYRYVTKESTLNSSGFSWQISLNSEYATDPLVLSKELQKSGCEILDVVRESKAKWLYVIDMHNARLNTQILESGEELRLKRSLYAYWLDVSKIKTLQINSSRRNNWYPYIAYYDKSLKLLRVLKKDTKKKHITLQMKENTYYLKISDIYTLKNIKDALVLTPIGERVEKVDEL